MKYCFEDKGMYNSVLAQLKVLGIKVPKKKIKTVSKQDKGLKQTKRVFGICLADQEKSSCSTVPKFVSSCTEYLQMYSKEVGIFRKAGSISRQKNLRVKIENGSSLEGSEPNDIASLLKQWLRELPEPLVPCYLYDSFIRCQLLSGEIRTTATLLMCLLLPPDHLVTLKHLMSFLADIATEKDNNNMDVRNLALIMSPNIFIFGNSVDKSSNLKVQQFSLVTQLLIENANKIGEVPPSLLKVPILESKSTSNSPCEGLESSPSVSRKQYLLRSIKRLVKQNAAPVNRVPMTRDNASMLLRHTLSVNNIEKASLKSISDTKGNPALLGARNYDDVCKRSFRLLRRKDKRRFAQYKECHPFTQSLEIDSPMNYMEDNYVTMFTPIQDSLLDKSSVGSLLTLQNFNDNRTALEDIEMTTFSTCMNEKSDNLVAFPMNFTQCSQTDQFLQGLENKQINKTVTRCAQALPIIALNDKETPVNHENLSQNDNIVSNSKHSTVNKNLHPFKTSEMARESRKNYANDSRDMFFRNTVENSRNINKHVLKTKVKESNQCSSKDSELTQNKSYERSKFNENECSDDFKMLRQTTFVVEPTSFDISTNKIKRPYIDDPNSLITSETIDKQHLSNKRQCTSLKINSKTHNKNPTFKTVYKKLTNSGMTNVARNKLEISLQKTKHEISNETSISSSLTKQMKNSKVVPDVNISTNLLEKGSLHCSLTESQVSRKQNRLSITKGKILEHAESSMKYSVETSTPKRKLSFKKNPYRSSNSDSKIPRLRNTSGVCENSFAEEFTSFTKGVSKQRSTKIEGSRDNLTRIPIKCKDDQNNLSTLELPMNDSCFLTPRRNAILSPNSITWMSGNKYFTSKTPEDTAFNKRESIAMILKTNSGHVQAKVHLYDDLVRESVVSTPTLPNHSTPASRFSRNSSSSQSMKCTPSQRKNGQNERMRFNRRNSVSRSSSLKNENSKSRPSKLVDNLYTPSPIKHLKDVTNTSVGYNESKNSKTNSQIKAEEGNVKNRKTLKRNSFNGRNSRKFFKKVSRSESSPCCPRPYIRVACSIQESHFE